MLQRAASNAYSWWSASHIRTKQARWLNRSLHEMEDKIQSVLGIIEDTDGTTTVEDICSRTKPELVSFVQEFHKAYRILADKYEYITGELQRANIAMASIYPEQAHFGMEDDDDAGSASPTVDDTMSPSHSVPHDSLPQSNQVTVGKTSILSKEKKTKEIVFARITSKDKAQGEIDKLQKGILVLQTEKEFVKSSFESGMAKYWDIEKLITQMQEKVNSLMDNFNASMVIEDHEARALMAITALRSCETNLLSLHEQQKRSMEEAKVESQNIKGIVVKLIALKGQHGQSEPNEDYFSVVEESTVTCMGNVEEELCHLNQETLELQEIYDKIRENFKKDKSIFMLAEDIDRLSEKVIHMETGLSIQAAQIRRLRLDIIEIQKHLQILEKEEKIFINDSNAFHHNLELVEEALHRVQKLAKHVQDENTKIRAHFTEACYTFNDLSKRLRFPDLQNGGSILESLQEDRAHQQDHEMQLLSTREIEEGSWFSDDTKNLKGSSMEGERIVAQEVIDQDKIRSASSSQSNNYSNNNRLLQQSENGPTDIMPPRKSDERQKHEGNIVKDQGIHAVGQQMGQSEEADEPSLAKLQQLFQDGLEDREKILLTEYTSILRNYKETKRKLAEAETKHQDHLSKTAAEIRDLRNVIVAKDEEIRSLRQNLHFLESCWNENLDYQAPEPEDMQHRKVACTAEEEGSWFSIAFNENTIQMSGNSDTHVEVDKRSLHVVDYNAFQQGEQIEEQTDVGSSVDGPPLQVDNERTGTKSIDKNPISEGSAVQHIQEQHAMNAVEENFQKDIDHLLEENIQLWSKFTSLFEQKSEYQIEVEDIQKEITKLSEEKKQEDNSCAEEPSGKPDAATICKLNDLQEKISAWIKQNSLLKEELHSRLSSLSNMGKEITNASTECKEGVKVQLSAYHAAKFQGEVLSMQQQNNKVAEELQQGLDCVQGLQSEVTKTLVKLGGSPKQTASKIQKCHNSRNLVKRLPLRSFLFGSKNKKPALFHCMNPALQKQYSDLAAGIPPK